MLRSVYFGGIRLGTFEHVDLQLGTMSPQGKVGAMLYALHYSWGGRHFTSSATTSRVSALL
jgi:hypothetical protein